MELKYVKEFGEAIDVATFNRTAYGIEIQLRSKRRLGV